MLDATDNESLLNVRFPVQADDQMNASLPEQRDIVFRSQRVETIFVCVRWVGPSNANLKALAGNRK